MRRWPGVRQCRRVRSRAFASELDAAQAAAICEPRRVEGPFGAGQAGPGAGTLRGVKSHPVIPIQAASLTTGDCAACLPSAAGPVCRQDLAASDAEPQLQGPPDVLQRVLQALSHDLAVQSPGGLLASGLVRGLRLSAQEAELTLAVAPRCGGALLADAAFQSLRRALPDTDIYVLHASP
jgi:hypothetical protein